MTKKKVRGEKRKAGKGKVNILSPPETKFAALQVLAFI